MNNTTLQVKGMGCGSCIRRIKEALGNVAGIATVEVQLRDQRVLVKHDSKMVSVESLVEALRGAGYESRAEG